MSAVLTAAAMRGQAMRVPAKGTVQWSVMRGEEEGEVVRNLLEREREREVPGNKRRIC